MGQESDIDGIDFSNGIENFLDGITPKEDKEKAKRREKLFEEMRGYTEKDLEGAMDYRTGVLTEAEANKIIKEYEDAMKEAGLDPDTEVGKNIEEYEETIYKEPISEPYLNP